MESPVTEQIQKNKKQKKKTTFQETSYIRHVAKRRWLLVPHILIRITNYISPRQQLNPQTVGPSLRGRLQPDRM